MTRIFRWLMRLFTGAVVLIALAVSVGYYLASRSLPDYDKFHSVSGLTGDVEIVRDNSGVPHIFGSTDADVFFGLGFAHAQDRLWQMTMLRRAAQGRLSEIFGARTVRTDELMRRLDLYRAAVDSLAVQDAETITALEAYSAGVNAWIRQVNEGALGRGAPEFFLFSPEIAPWRPADSLAVIKIMALQLSSHMRNEILRAQTSLVLPSARLQDIMPDAPGAGLAELPDYASLIPTLPHPETQVAGGDWLMPVQPLPFAGASNAWAAAPRRSAAGSTLLANDPHLGFSAPSTWYLARIELTTGGVIGATIPGMPVVLLGRSETLGWGLTSAYVDDQDIFIEELNPGNTEQYRTPAGWAPFRTEKVILNVKDETPITLTLRWTENGPVLPGSHFNLGSVTPPGHVAALGWTALSRRDTTMSAAIALMRAKSVQDGIDAGEHFIAPAQNVIFVDAEQIALQVVGAIPSRNIDHDSQGRLPALGWQAQNRWNGRLPYDSNPRFVNPQGGILGNTNNKTIGRPFPNHVSHSWGDTQRVQRWERLMQERQVHTRESFISVQLDTTSVTARTLLPLIAADLWFQGEAAPEGTPERLRQRALDLLADWDGEMNEHRAEPLIYAAWLRTLQQRLIRDELGPLATRFQHPEPLFIERVFRDLGGASAWCDVIQSGPTETCVDVARIALDEALVWVTENHGGALESLHWGDAHQATHDHPVLGEIPLLKWVVNIRQSTSGGDHTLMRGVTKGTDPEPFLNVHGAGYRGVYDFADPDSSVFIISTGQSGHPLSRHYDDLGVLWRRGEYIPMSLDPALARAANTGITVLRPQ